MKYWYEKEMDDKDCGTCDGSNDDSPRRMRKRMFGDAGTGKVYGLPLSVGETFVSYFDATARNALKLRWAELRFGHDAFPVHLPMVQMAWL